MTLNITLRVALGSGIIFTKFDLRQIELIRACLNYSVFDAGTLCQAATLTFEALNLKVRGTKVSRGRTFYEI